MSVAVRNSFSRILPKMALLSLVKTRACRVTWLDGHKYSFSSKRRLERLIFELNLRATLLLLLDEIEIVAFFSASTSETTSPYI